MTTVKIDKNFKIVDKSQTKGVQSSIQIGSDVLVLVFLDRIELMDLKNNTAVTKKVAKAELVSGTYTDQGYLIAFHENKKDFKYFFVKDGITTDIKLAATMIPENKGGYFERVTAAADNKYAYIMVEVKTAFDRYGIVRNIAFSLDGKEQNINDFKFGAYRSISGPVNISSGDEARFVATTPRKFEKKGTQFDIIEFTLKDGAVQNYSIASRTNEPSLYPAAADNMLIFCNNTGEDQYEVLAASKDKAFKEVNNLPRKEESSRAISDVILDLINSFFLLFVFGLKWILFGLVAISIVSYLSHTMSIKYRKILYVLSYLVTVAVKVSTIYGLARMRNLPGPLQYPAVIIGVCLGLSALCLLFGYGKYRRDTEAIPAWSYSQAVFIDSLLTQMIFIPYIV